MADASEPPSRLVRHLRPFWSASRAAEALGLDDVDDLAALASAGGVLALPTSDGHLIVPARQFVRVDGRTLVRPGLAEVLLVLRDHDPWAVAVLVLATPAPELDAVPREVADGTHDDALREFAQRVRREWSDGRESPHDDGNRVLDVLNGRTSYDDVDRNTQVLVRAVWNERVRAAREDLDLAAEFIAGGRSWSEADAEGNVVRRNDPPASSDPCG